MNKKFGIAMHGGAGTILKLEMNPEKEAMYTDALKEAVLVGDAILEKGGLAIDAVEAVVKKLEDHPLFNAGKGSVFTHEGKNEMDASIMDGRTLKAGAISGVRNVRNPIQLARTVMDHTEHVFLSG
ncbi:MAG: isoaspartyl peptidase/L-asparaginase, partial [Bacteroidia bacterium]